MIRNTRKRMNTWTIWEPKLFYKLLSFCAHWRHQRVRDVIKWTDNKLCSNKITIICHFDFVSGELFIFYSIFYIVLAILFAICMKGLMSTIDERTPTWLLHESRIGNNPGLGFRPISKNLTQGSLIWFDSKNDTEVRSFTEWIFEFMMRKLSAVHLFSLFYVTSRSIPFAAYMRQKLKPPTNSMECNFTTPVDPDYVCRFDLDTLGNCTVKNAYGYKTSQPCVFLKLNRVNFGIDSFIHFFV